MFTLSTKNVLHSIHIIMSICLCAFETGIADIELSAYIPLNWIPRRNIWNLNTFDNFRFIHLLNLEMCFQQ